MRNGNEAKKIEEMQQNTLFILPMRNGNFAFEYIFFFPILLFILPMRNGNAMQVDLISFLITTFYPTYEEWKPMMKMEI